MLRAAGLVQKPQRFGISSLERDRLTALPSMTTVTPDTVTVITEASMSTDTPSLSTAEAVIAAVESSNTAPAPDIVKTWCLDRTHTVVKLLVALCSVTSNVPPTQSSTSVMLQSSGNMVDWASNVVT
jgi:hypothetical protein